MITLPCTWCALLQYVGLLFNLAKAEQQLGRQERSQALMGQVLQQAKGVAGGKPVWPWVDRV